MKKLMFLSLLFFSFGLFAQNELPKIDLQTLDGKTYNSRNIARDEGVTIISLWATWCVPCLKELDAISEVYQDWQDESNVELFAISVDDSRTIKRVKPMVNGKGWDYTVLLDTNNDFQRAVGAATVPMTFLVKDNQIVYRHSGYSPGSEFELYERILELSN